MYHPYSGSAGYIHANYDTYGSKCESGYRSASKVKVEQGRSFAPRMSVDSLGWYSQPLQPQRPPGSQSQPGFHSQPLSDSGTDSQNATLAGTPPSNLVHFPYGTKTGHTYTTKNQWDGSGRNRSRETVHTHPYGNVQDSTDAHSQSRTSFLGSLRADLTRRAARIVTNMRSRIRSNRWPPRHRTLTMPTFSVVWRPCHSVEREDPDAFP